VKRNPYIVIFLLGWALAVPAIFVRYPEFGIVAKIFAAILRGIFPMLIGWITVYLNRTKEPENVLQRGALSVTLASIIFLALAVWASSHESPA
jgi:hypothetical protein